MSDRTEKPKKTVFRPNAPAAALAIALSLALGGCFDGDDNDGPGASSTTSVTGGGVKGPLADATVTA